MNCDVLDEIERVARKKHRGVSQHDFPRPRETYGGFQVYLEVTIDPEEVENICKDKHGVWKMRT